jgi:hypothetical protein
MESVSLRMIFFSGCYNEATLKMRPIPLVMLYYLTVRRIRQRFQDTAYIQHVESSSPIIFNAIGGHRYMLSNLLNR